MALDFFFSPRPIWPVDPFYSDRAFWPKSRTASLFFSAGDGEDKAATPPSLSMNKELISPLFPTPHQQDE